FGITATGAFLIACLGEFPLLGALFQVVGFCYVYLVMWGLCAYLTKSFRLPATWVIAWPTCCLMLGQLVGGVTSSVLGQQESAGFWIQMMAMSTVFVLLLASLVLLSNKNLATGWGMASPASFLTPVDSAVDAVVKQLAVEDSLTPREAEVFALMARGRNRRIISEMLIISEETTKSHINGLYRKLGVHSQQELLTVVEQQASALQSEAQGLAFEEAEG
ncbi:MAG: helix-turn-helix transcriptional regulator, partial [Coriobacteriales bacterium]|nr:helix-turn-helix transcriptional regulator [Coriobacteriales bacterium]